MAAPTRAETPLRADAARNREALVEAARVVFGERGLDAPLDEIARRASVGNATLYRHFPDRCALVSALFVSTFEDVLSSTARALASDDAWEGFVGHVERVCAMQAADKGLADLLTTSIEGAAELERLRSRAYREFVEISQRAKDAGALRPDFEPSDLVLLLIANAGVIHHTASDAPGAWRRLVAVTVDGWRNQGAPAGHSVAAPSRAAMRRAMARHATGFGFGAGRPL